MSIHKSPRPKALTPTPLPIWERGHADYKVSRLTQGEGLSALHD